MIVSIVSDSVTNDAEIDSRKPNRPTVRLMPRAPSVEAVQPAASRPTSGRGHNSYTAARRNAATASSRNGGPSGCGGRRRERRGDRGMHRLGIVVLMHRGGRLRHGRRGGRGGAAACGQRRQKCEPGGSLVPRDSAQAKQRPCDSLHVIQLAEHTQGHRALLGRPLEFKLQPGGEAQVTMSACDRPLVADGLGDGQALPVQLQRAGVSALLALRCQAPAARWPRPEHRPVPGTAGARLGVGARAPGSRTAAGQGGRCRAAPLPAARRGHLCLP